MSPTVAVRFDEEIPSHQQAYFDELTKYVSIEVTETSASTDPKDYQYLVGIKYTDPDDLIEYVTTRITVERKTNWIVAYRVPYLANGKTSGREESRPIHVAEVVRMVEASKPRKPLYSPVELSVKQTMESHSSRALLRPLSHLAVRRN